MLLEKNKLKEALRRLAEDAYVYVPGQFSGAAGFVLWDGEDTVMPGGNTELPPKDILFPQTEKMYSFTTGAKADINEIRAGGKQVVFGIRPCDMGSVGRLDRVFLEDGRPDGFYARKRENTTFIAVACDEPARTCFCDSMGLDPNGAPAADVLLNGAGDLWGVAAQSEKGRAVAKLWGGLLIEGESSAGKTVCTLKTEMSDSLPGKLADMFEHPIWEEVSKACIGCAVCTYVCPTCYCFDIGNMSHGGEGAAFRCWDSCMFSDYTRMAGGHNPRPTKKERIRNRYMHKLSFFYQRYGTALCTGCGRCLEKCPAHLDIAGFIDRAAAMPETS